MLEQGLHADAEVLIVAVDGGPVLGLAVHAGAADPVGAMMWSRRASSAAMVRAACGGTW